jgi:hypothetical protein
MRVLRNTQAPLSLRGSCSTAEQPAQPRSGCDRIGRPTAADPTSERVRPQGLSANRKHHHLELHNGPAAPLCLLRSPLIQAAQIMKLEVLPTSSPLRCRGHGRAAIRVLVMGKSASCGPVDPVWQLLASGRELQPGCPYPGQTVLMNVKLSNRTRFRYVMLQSTTFGGPGASSKPAPIGSLGNLPMRTPASLSNQQDQCRISVRH